MVHSRPTKKYVRGKGGLRFKKDDVISNSKSKNKTLAIKRNIKHQKAQERIKSNIENNKSHSSIRPTESQGGDVTDTDSEHDAYSQLLTCFSASKKIKITSVISDDDSDSDDEQDQEEYAKNVAMNIPDGNSNTSQESKNELIPKNSELYDEDDLDLHYTAEMKTTSESDPFENHIQYDLDDGMHDAVSSIPQKAEETFKNWPVLGQLKILLPNANSSPKVKMSFRIDDDKIYAKPGSIPVKIQQVSSSDWDQLFVKTQIQNNILRANRIYVNESLGEEDQLSPLQRELFSLINNYQDLYYPERSLDNGEEVRFVYCLHSINHVLKTRLKVVHHNSRLANKQELNSDIPDDYRDQGLVRPKVLILVPFRNSAVRIVEMLSSILLEEGNNNILNKKRFYDEFSMGEIAMPKKNPKPEDYEKTFSGDTDDNFKIGLSVTKKSLKLYADFYSSDIIIASPLGLRVIVGADGQADRDYDFLASVEILILDQAEIILMQNWDHLLHIWDHLHLQPRQSHGTNFARVRPWALSGRARFYRQTLLFSAHVLPQISALFSRKCHNYAGKVWVVNPIATGSICQIVLQLPQVFNRIECSSATASIDARFEHLVNKVLPQYKEPLMNHTLIYVPSYFDYVRIRNYFKKELVSFVQICEYSKDAKVARARDMFFHSSAHFLLYSERFHFFRRIRLKGIHHIVFYQPPTFPHFYSELCNLMQSNNQSADSLSVSVMYTKYDAAQVAAIVGSDRAAKMLSSERAVHMFMTGD